MSATIITFVQQKGGVGKTTLLLNVALSLARLGKRVAVMDMGNLLAASAWLEGAQSIEHLPIQCLTTAEWRFKQDVATLRDQVDIILIDSVAHTEAEMQAHIALQVSDMAVIPMQPGVFDEKGAITTAKVVEKARVPYRVVLNRWSDRLDITIPEKFRPFVLHSRVKHDEAFVRAQLGYMPLWDVPHSASASRAIDALADEISALFSFFEEDERVSGARVLATV